ncbi:hypothetical protein PAHAL_9G591600 [Panicum hallii]|uniref:Uncharacterized protein n=1 Tax=Panicum hallii TaxID=206008 RepID=A0A2S3IUN8_9POAL|nr:hypothetical protein PAHAL_9G591600 [Panicum hallii]
MAANKEVQVRARCTKGRQRGAPPRGRSRVGGCVVSRRAATSCLDRNGSRPRRRSRSRASDLQSPASCAARKQGSEGPALKVGDAPRGSHQHARASLCRWAEEQFITRA